MKTRQKFIEILGIDLYVILFKKQESKRASKWLKKELDVELSSDYLGSVNGCLHRHPSGGLTVLCVLEDENVEIMYLRFFHELFHFCWWAGNVMKSEEYGARLYTVLYEWGSKILVKSKNTEENHVPDSGLG